MSFADAGDACLDLNLKTDQGLKSDTEHFQMREQEKSQRQPGPSMQ
jgi:hypothetical protein